MTFEDEFEAELARQLQQAPLPDDGFSDRVAASLGSRRVRRLVLACAAASAAAVTGVALSSVSTPARIEFALAPRSIVAALFLVTVCSLIWIGTEAGAPTSGASAETAARSPRPR